MPSLLRAITLILTSYFYTFFRMFGMGPKENSMEDPIVRPIPPDNYNLTKINPLWFTKTWYKDLRSAVDDLHLSLFQKGVFKCFLSLNCRKKRNYLLCSRTSINLFLWKQNKLFQITLLIMIWWRMLPVYCKNTFLNSSAELNWLLFII